jgi:hypothetical protein
MIEVEKAQGFPVSLACELLSVSRSGFWQWERRPPSQRELSDAWLTEKIKQIHTENRGVYGARRIHAELRMTHDVRVGKKRVARLMRQAGISGLMPKKRGRTTIRVPGVPVADDLVKRQFKPDSPNVLWFTDITYLRTWVRIRPSTFAPPQISSQVPEPLTRCFGSPLVAAIGAVITSPVSMTHASTAVGGIMRLERDEHRIDTAHASAAPAPPRIAITQPPLAPITGRASDP